MKNKLFISSLFIAGLYLGLCVYYYVNQERMIFAPIPLEKEYTFQLENSFEEVFLETPDGIQLHGLFFQQENPKGVIYYLHGKSGNMKTWAPIANHYLDWGYDVFMLDYRGFGMSEGKIHSEEQFYSDVQLGYNFLKNKYAENKISVVGFSLGSGAATFLAKENNPQELILLAPYFQVDEKFKQDKFYLPKFLCKYEFPIDEMIQHVEVPIKIFYGEEDVISHKEEILHLQKFLKPNDLLIGLKNQGHNGMEKNEDFIKNLNLDNLKTVFNKYSTHIYFGPLAELDFSKNKFKSDSNFVNFINNETLKSPINFAGEYTLIEKSCGVDCSHIFIINRVTGKVFDSISINDESCGFLYQPTSYLLIRNSNYLLNGNLKYYNEINCLPIYYLWNGKDFEIVEID
ncbi:alpha/beta hydrolase [Moheibacter stercoris]|uniref:Pimeloyl-ACP methyl ester carboxylesterase n=1 Tax=Moheibacter stercoris TaxID=1628251 RepID=A0ABV2LU44_9FLAO